MQYAFNTLKALPGTITKIWPLGERIHAPLTDTGQPTAGIFPYQSPSRPFLGWPGRF
jgi:hypothetical protein